MGSVGFREILIILLIVLILFGAKRIPELMRSMGKGISEFKGGLRGDPERGAFEADALDPRFHAGTWAGERSRMIRSVRSRIFTRRGSNVRPASSRTKARTWSSGMAFL